MPVGDEWTTVTREGKLLNKPFTNIIENWHKGKLPVQPYSGIRIDCANVMLSAIKRSEDGTGMIVRLYEIAGKEANVTVSGDMIPAEIKDTITPWSVETYYLADGSKEWKKVLLTEMDFD